MLGQEKTNVHVSACVLVCMLITGKSCAARMRNTINGITLKLALLNYNKLLYYYHTCIFSIMSEDLITQFILCLRKLL